MRFLGLIFLFFSIQLSAQHVDWDVHYGPAIEQVYDYYAGPMESNKCFVVLHGGGWTGGDKTDWGGSCRILQAGGYHVININYRFASPTWHWQDMNTDIQAAIDRIQIQHPQIDTFYMIGGSAGATMCFNYARTGDVRIKFIIAASGIYDFTSNWNQILSEDIQNYTNGDFVGASPSLNVYNYPHSAIIHGLNDNLFQWQQAADFSTRLHNHGIWNWMYVKRDMEHYLTYSAMYQLMYQIVAQIKYVP